MQEEIELYLKYYYRHMKRKCAIIVITAETQTEADDNLRDLVALPFMWSLYDTVKLGQGGEKNEQQV